MLSLHKLLGYWTKNSCESIATAKAFIICTAIVQYQVLKWMFLRNILRCTAVRRIRIITISGSRIRIITKSGSRIRIITKSGSRIRMKTCWSRHTDVYSTVLNIWICAVVCFHMKYTWNISCCFSYPIYSYSTVYCVSISHIWFWVIFSGYYCSI